MLDFFNLKAFKILQTSKLSKCKKQSRSLGEGKHELPLPKNKKVILLNYASQEKLNKGKMHFSQANSSFLINEKFDANGCAFKV